MTSHPTRHFYTNSAERFPALKELPHLHSIQTFLLSGALCMSLGDINRYMKRLIDLIDLTWQMLYWKFVLTNRRQKIESGQRITSFVWLLNDKRGLIGRMIASTRPELREPYFMFGQFGTTQSFPSLVERLMADAIVLPFSSVRYAHGASCYLRPV
jgi:hypothetical protein